MKPGAGDDPFADDDGDGETGHDAGPAEDGDRGSVQITSDEEPSPDAEDAAVDESDDGGSNDGESDSGGIPYVYRRDTVKEGRDQIPIFLREHVREGERDLRRELESLLGEDVAKTDLREAAMVVAQRHPELVADVLREWGYDYE